MIYKINCSNIIYISSSLLASDWLKELVCFVSCRCASNLLSNFQQVQSSSFFWLIGLNLWVWYREDIFQWGHRVLEWLVWTWHHEWLSWHCQKPVFFSGSWAFWFYHRCHTKFYLCWMWFLRGTWIWTWHHVWFCFSMFVFLVIWFDLVFQKVNPYIWVVWTVYNLL